MPIDLPCPKCGIAISDKELKCFGIHWAPLAVVDDTKRWHVDCICGAELEVSVTAMAMRYSANPVNVEVRWLNKPPPVRYRATRLPTIRDLLNRLVEETE